MPRCQIGVVAMKLAELIEDSLYRFPGIKGVAAVLQVASIDSTSVRERKAA